jgi:hypothetical protein
VPSTEEQRAAELEAVQRDAERGRFRERIIVWPFGQIGGDPPFDRQTIEQTIVTCGPGNPSFVRMTAIRGLLAAQSGDTTEIDLAILRLRLQCNGLDLITDGQGGNTASFALLFGGVPTDPTLAPDNDDDPDVPWYWFAAPPRLRVGDKLVATVYDITRQELKRHTPQLAARIIDDRYWQLMYTLDTAYDDAMIEREGEASDYIDALDAENAP